MPAELPKPQRRTLRSDPAIFSEAKDWESLPTAYKVLGSRSKGKQVFAQS